MGDWVWGSGKGSTALGKSQVAMAHRSDNVVQDLGDGLPKDFSKDILEGLFDQIDNVLGVSIGLERQGFGLTRVGEKVERRRDDGRPRGEAGGCGGPSGKRSCVGGAAARPAGPAASPGKSRQHRRRGVYRACQCPARTDRH